MLTGARCRYQPGAARIFAGAVATHAYGDAGTHYLSVNTEGCSWSLVPVTV